MLTAAMLWGIWQYEAYRYKGQLFPPHNVSRMVYEFKEDGTDRLFWTVDDNGQFCERYGKYSLQNSWLSDEVTAVHPENAAKCSRDPDMRVGHKTQTWITFENSRLILRLPLGAEQIDLIFSRVLPLGKK